MGVVEFKFFYSPGDQCHLPGRVRYCEAKGEDSGGQRAERGAILFLSVLLSVFTQPGKLKLMTPGFPGYRYELMRLDSSAKLQVMYNQCPSGYLLSTYSRNGRLVVAVGITIYPPTMTTSSQYVPNL